MEAKKTGIDTEKERENALVAFGSETGPGVRLIRCLNWLALASLARSLAWIFTGRALLWRRRTKGGSVRWASKRLYIYIYLYIAPKVGEKKQIKLVGRSLERATRHSEGWRL